MKVSLRPRTAALRIKRRLKRIERAITEEAAQEVEAVADRTHRRVVALTPGTRLPAGWLRDDIRRPGLVRFTIRNEVAETEAGRRLIRYLEFGTRPHQITATRAQVLAFEIAGRIIFRRTVNHPGNRQYGMIRISSAEAAAPMDMITKRLERMTAQLWGTR